MGKNKLNNKQAAEKKKKGHVAKRTGTLSSGEWGRDTPSRKV
jgi:hypothetical protein